MGRHSTAIVAETITPPQSPSRKRKRDEDPVEEIEVNISAPEPPSKKALRKAKKAKSTVKLSAVTPTSDDDDPAFVSTHVNEVKTDDTTSKRSEYGIWIGNLPWTATKLDLRTFLTKDTAISDDAITRLHLPPPSKSAVASSRQGAKPQNKGFAYVDFSSQEGVTEALSLSERLMTGRRVLIKDAKSFDGRPEKSNEEKASAISSDKPPSKTIFVGNLAFDTTKEILKDHFEPCGEVLDVHVATFEDTGKCKGYAWVEFDGIEAGETAVRGWVNMKQNHNDEEEDEKIAEALADTSKGKKVPRVRKWWVNKLGGRPLRMEFAEGKDIRYKKRYGKESSSRNRGETAEDPESQPAAEPVNGGATSVEERKKTKPHTNANRKVDARTIRPGAALAAAPRLTGGIVESQGKKTIFA